MGARGSSEPHFQPIERMEQQAEEKIQGRYWTRHRILISVVSYSLGIGLGFGLVALLPRTTSAWFREIFPFLFGMAVQTFASEFWGSSDKRGNFKTALMLFGVTIVGIVLGLLAASRW